VRHVRHERTAAAAALIADTFLPAADGLPSASELGAVDMLFRQAAANPRSAERTQLDRILSLWDTRTFGLLTRGRPTRYSSLSQSEREAFILSLTHSSIPQKRTLAQAFKFGLLLGGYASPGPTGTSPRWEAMGYDPPFGIRPDAPPRAITPLRITEDSRLTCDVVVVGAGAGGGTAAAVLAAAGLDVIVLEAGDYNDDADLDGSEHTAFTRLYAAAPTFTAEGQIGLMQGVGLGGGTVINYTTSFRTPDDIRAEWAAVGAHQFTDDEYTRALDAVYDRLSINTEHRSPGVRDALLERGAQKLGWHIEPTPRNVVGCEQDVECGRCGLGCRIGAKQSTAKTWLVDAAAAGARIVVGARAMTVTMANGEATGVEAMTTEGHRLTVRSRAVVSAGGSLQTPALLRRSGLTNANIGRYLRLHPATGLWSRYDEEVRPWTGPPQSRYCKEHRDLDGHAHGAIYETAPATPAFSAGLLPWHGAEAHAGLMRDLRHLSVTAVIIRDRDPGHVSVGRDGEPVAHYRLSKFDAAHFHRGIVGAAEIAEAAGATEIFSAHAKPVSYEPGRRGSLEQFAAAAQAAGYAPGRVTIAALHIMGTARMGGDPTTSATNPDGATWDVPNIVVADSSCFPTASGVNPMVSIEAIAHMNATRLAARLT
jgi:long-chain-alcohol oxidase